MLNSHQLVCRIQSYTNNVVIYNLCFYLDQAKEPDNSRCMFNLTVKISQFLCILFLNPGRFEFLRSHIRTRESFHVEPSSHEVPVVWKPVTSTSCAFFLPVLYNTICVNTGKEIHTCLNPFSQ